MTARYSLSLPLAGLPLRAHREVVGEPVELGYTGVSSRESAGADGLVPPAMAAAWAPHLDLVSGVVPAQTRGPAVSAQSFAIDQLIVHGSPEQCRARIAASDRPTPSTENETVPV